jgi:hypothetical protein
MSSRLQRRAGTRPLSETFAAALVAVVLVVPGRGAGPRFFPDDPIQIDDDTALDASGALPIGEGSNLYDFTEHTFMKPGDRTGGPARNVNTMDDVPDSTWFTNRIGRRPMSIDEIVRGSDQNAPPNVDGWPIVRGKSAGVTAGYRVADPTGHLYQIKFDPPGNPEMGIAAELIGAAIYHALGYNVVQEYIVDVDPTRIVIDPKATMVDLTGRRRAMTREDVDNVLARAARQPNGKYRALASRFADGKPLGHFKYYGTRSDDPNDIHPHEHRRELRGNRVFAAWLNHDDSRGINSLDLLEGPQGRQHIRHYMFDFGSIMGSGTNGPQAPRAGNEYILEWKPAFKTLATLGLYVRPWALVRYPKTARAVGRFEADFFDPLAWKPEYPNPAFDNMQPEDAFWAARLVSMFSDDVIRAVVGKGRYSEAGAPEQATAILIRRRDKVLKTWLTGVNPLVDPRLDANGVLTFGNAAAAARVASPPSSYTLTWSRFDNASGDPIGASEETRASEPMSSAPARVLDSAEFVSVAVRTVHPDYPHWTAPVTFYFRRAPGGWQAVGLARSPR